MGKRFHAPFLRPTSFGDNHHRARPVQAQRITALLVSSLRNKGFSLVSISALASGLRCSPFTKELSPLRVLDLYRDDLVLESVNGQCLTEPILRPQGSLVPVLSGDLKLLG